MRYNQINGGSANGDAFVDWHLTEELSVQVSWITILMFLRLGHVHAHVTPPHSSLPDKCSSRAHETAKTTKTARTTPYTYAILHRQEPTTSANRSKSCPYNPYTPMLANKWLMLCFVPEPTNRMRNFVDYRIKTPVLRMLFDPIKGRLIRSEIWGQVSLVLPDNKWG